MAGKTKCGVCGKRGHNARTCPNKKQAAKEKAAAKAKAKALPQKRTPEGKFADGCKGNPGGWTKEKRQARETLREYIRGKIEIEETNIVIDRLIYFVDTAGPRDAIEACKTLLEYCYGKPPTVAEIDANADDSESGQVLVIGGTEIRF